MNPMLRMLATGCLSLTLMGLAGAGAPIHGQEAGGAVVMDTNAIHASYLDGDFEKATADLKQAIAGNSLHSRSDSVFAFKHLGVMAAANPETREKGKYYMVQLLNLEPSIKILDMYASDMIYMIFKNLKEEYEENRMKMRRAESHVAGNRQSGPGNASDSAAAAEAEIAAAWNTSHPPGPFPTPVAAARSSVDAPAAAPPAGPPAASVGQATATAPATGKPGLKKWFWIGSAGAVLVGAGITTYLLEKKPEAEKVTYVVD